jgi:hypothetical protein
MLSVMADPERAPELLRLRAEVRSWRFYDHFRADSESAVRQIQLGTRTPVLAHDGRDVAAAIQTIIEIGDRTALDRAPATIVICGTLGRDASIPFVDRGTPDAASPRVDDSERAGNESAPRSVARAGAADIADCEANADLGGITCISAPSGLKGGAALTNQTEQGVRRNGDRRSGSARCTVMTLA